MGDDLPYDSRATYELFRLAQVLDPLERMPFRQT